MSQSVQAQRAGYESLTDPELLSLCASKDESAFEALLSRYEKFVFSAVRYELKNDDDAFDVSQEVFLRLYNAAGGFRCESTLKTWLFRMCKNCAYDFMRKNYKHKFLSLTPSEDGEGETEIPSYDTPDEDVLRKERIETVRLAIRSLSEEHRDVIVLRELQELSYGEIADLLGLSEGTVKSRINRAREALKKILANDL